MRSKANLHYIDNAKGQAVILSVILLPVCIALLSQILYFSRFIERKIMLQNGIDVALLSGTQILADGLNRIRSLNQKLVQYHRLLLLAQAGTVLTQGGTAFTEKTLRIMIQATAFQQDVIKNTYPLLAAKKVTTLAQKNNTPHVFLFPPLLFYRLERLPSRNGLPYLYQLKMDFPSHKTWSIRGYMYKKSYQAKASCALQGVASPREDLLHSRWKGVFTE